MKQGDRVVTYDTQNRRYFIGSINGDYKYNTAFEYPHTRPVHWDGEVPRGSLTTPTKNSLGAISTLFKVPEEAEKEILELLGRKIGPRIEPINREELENEKEDKEGKAHELIKDKISELDPYQAQDLVAGLLRAMGYKTVVSPPGTDKGIDVWASPDGLFMKEPRIIAQVKHRKGQVSREEMSSFAGKIKEGMNGLYVSTGRFTKPALEEANGAQYQLQVLDFDSLVDLITQHYDSFDSDARSLIPLSRIYWPL
jgi:restriction system protein